MPYIIVHDVLCVSVSKVFNGVIVFFCVVTKAFITIILFSKERCPLFRVSLSFYCELL